MCTGCEQYTGSSKVSIRGVGGFRVGESREMSLMASIATEEAACNAWRGEGGRGGKGGVRVKSAV